MKPIKLNIIYILIVIIAIDFLACDNNKVKVKVRKICSEQNNRKPDISPMNKQDSEIFAQDTIKNPSISFTLITLPSLQCSTCQDSVENALNRDTGIIRLLVDSYKKVVYVNYDSLKTNVSSMENLITKAGYDANNKVADNEAYERLDECCKIPDELINK
ncbi:MAG TPA: hypothetical protein VHP32_06845 [Ignavibacteria bacterium]|nr:hypothetical protein [Ignavibacteria bacterium]